MTPRNRLLITKVTSIGYKSFSKIYGITCTVSDMETLGKHTFAYQKHVL